MRPVSVALFVHAIYRAAHGFIYELHLSARGAGLNWPPKIVSIYYGGPI